MVQRVRVALLPSLIDSDSLCDHSVVVTDILRATTTICMALANGIRDVVPTPDIGAAMATRNEIGHIAILGGERGGVIIDGFDQGNSPLEYTTELCADRRLVLCTTNGTVAMECCRAAERVVIGSFANLTAVAGSISNAEQIAIVCAGTNRQVTSEDVLFAGALADRLVIRNPATILDDQARLAVAHWRVVQNQIAGEGLQLWQSIADSIGGRNLLQLGYDDDVKFCSQLDLVNFAPELDLETWTIRLP